MVGRWVYLFIICLHFVFLFVKSSSYINTRQVLLRFFLQILI
jgi:hypothetical protein